jgi:hypothetical protein
MKLERDRFNTYSDFAIEEDRSMNTEGIISVRSRLGRMLEITMTNIFMSNKKI